MGTAIVVTSGKGGVGKTTSTANIGAALALRGRSVCLIDADVGLRNLDVVLGLENRVSRHFLDVIEKKCELDDALVKDKRVPSMMLLPAAQTREKDDVRTADMVALVEELRKRFDYVLIDSPAGIEMGFKNAVAGAQRAIVVTTPEVSAVRDADRVVGLLPKGIEVQLIVNRLRPQLVRRGKMLSVAQVDEILRLPLLGVVPDEPEVVVATNRGEPVSLDPSSRTGEAYRRAVARLEGEQVEIEDYSAEGGFFEKLAAWIGGRR
ncbi:MAG TPA: septum site-determining protein MinD [Candidatus Dormibacteraeota bacterium]|nr:septum site-determining protein MinD [Candidatus Dormibacteraeota bacterium]